VNGQAVANEREVQSAWARPVDGRTTLTVEREGRELEFGAPTADPRVRTSVDLGPWQGTEGPSAPSD